MTERERFWTGTYVMICLLEKCSAVLKFLPVYDICINASLLLLDSFADAH